METFSRMLPLTTSLFPPGLREELLASIPLIFEEDLSASYILRDPHSYTHNPTRAAIAITTHHRLVVMNGKAKKIDIPLGDPQWFSAVSIWSDKRDRVNFKVKLGVAGVGTSGSSLEIKVKTSSAREVVELVAAARGAIISAHSSPPNMPLERVGQAPQELSSQHQQSPSLHYSTQAPTSYAELSATNYRTQVPPRKPVPTG